MTRGSSLTLIGRDADLGRLRAAAADIRGGDRPVVLVSGEAGIGKSRLLAEFERSASADPPGQRPVRFLHSGCLEVGESLAYLPILEWLNELAADPASASDAVERLRDGFGGSGTAATGDAADATAGRSTRFQQLRDALVGLTADADVVAVIDDLHWADRSTLDVVSFLARRLGGTGVLLLLAFRSDELHRRHPLTPVLAELERSGVRDHIRLQPLTTDDVTAQIAAILDRPPTAQEAARLVARADGNPFHVEELLALQPGSVLPATLHDVLSARLGAVDDATLDVVRDGAIIGRTLDAELLARTSRSERAVVEAGLRSAVEARILVSEPDGRHYRFRHALLREAVYDGVLPSDRVAMHRRIAEAIAADPGLADAVPAVAIADLARHWLAARAEPEAFAALIAAGRSATSAAAWPEGLAAYAEALTLWDRVPDPGSSGMARSHVLEEAATLAWYSGDTRRAIELVETAVEEPDVLADPPRLCRLLDHESWFVHEFAEYERSRVLARRAVEVVPEFPPTIERASALATLAIHVADEGHTGQAITMIESAASAVEASGRTWGEFDALPFLAGFYAEAGMAAKALETLEYARVQFRSDQMTGGFFGFTTNAPWVWLYLGDLAEAVREAERSMQAAQAQSLDAGGGLWFSSPRAEAEFRLGDWTAASRTIEEASAYPPASEPTTMVESVRIRILAGLGQFDEAHDSADQLLALVGGGVFMSATAIAVAAAWAAAVGGDHGRAAAVLRSWVERWHDTDSIVIRADILHLAAWVSMALAETAGSSDDGADLAEYVERSLAETARDGASRDGADPQQLLAGACLARRSGADTPANWALAAGELERVRYVPLATLARLGEAEARLRAGDRLAAEGALRAMVAHADAMGATALREMAERLARAGRLRLDEAAGPSRDADPGDGASAAVADPWGLSPRELEVLALVADGRTNAQIGEALFISDKTASVHVTHILDKMGVSSRVEAALGAVRAGIVAGEPPG